jgi:uncharacterized OsmC-like protein
MNADEVTSSLHAAFKDRFRDHPEAAHITMRAQGRVGQGGTCQIETHKAGIQAGLHPAVGGDGLSACAGDMLLEALVACAGVTLGQVATAMDIRLRDAIVRAEGDLDFRGSLGMSEEIPVGLEAIRLHFEVDAEATEEQLAMLIRLTERYCVVSRTLNPPAVVTFSPSTGS